MKIKLPIQTKELKGEELVKIESEKEFELDTTLAAQIRFETKFPELAQNEDLFDYSKRITANEQLTAGVIISKMKMLYCWLETDIDFVQFLKMFDLTDIEYITKLTNCIKKAIEIVFNSSAEKN